MPFPFINHASISTTSTTTTDDKAYHASDDRIGCNDDDSQVIMARLAAKEQYQQQKQRLRQLFQQKLNLRNQQHRDGNDVSTNASSQQLQYQYNNRSNTEQQHDEHEIVIHPESLEGTLESASFHLHGQTGGRRKSDHPGMTNAAVMNGNVLRNMKENERNNVNDVFEDNFDTNVRIDSLEQGFHVISSGRGGGCSTNKRNNLINNDCSHQDLWSTGVAAAVVMGTASRYHKAFFMFPHGRKIILPIIMGILALCLSIVTLKSCRLMTILPSENSHQVFQLGPWNYLSPVTW